MIKERLLKIWGRYFSFEGRISRRALWFRFFEFPIILSLGIVIFFAIQYHFFAPDPASGTYSRAIDSILAKVLGLFWLFTLVSAVVRRLHDINRSAWWFAVLYFGPILFGIAINEFGSFKGNVPGFIILILIILMIPGMIWSLELKFRRGTIGPNRFGPDPLDRVAQND